MITVVVSIPLMMMGGSLVAMIFGPDYASIGTLVACLAAMQAVRILRIPPTLAATAVGDTRNAMFANMVRTTALIGALSVAVIGGDLYLIALAGLLGETMALGVSLARLRKRQAIPLRLCLRPAAVVTIALASAACALVTMGIPGLTGGLVTSMVLVGIAVLVMRSIFRQRRPAEQTTTANLLAPSGEAIN